MTSAASAKKRSPRVTAPAPSVSDDAEWFATYPHRQFRLREPRIDEPRYASRPAESLQPVTVVCRGQGRLCAESILILGEPINSDRAARFALRFFADQVLPRIEGDRGR